VEAAPKNSESVYWISNGSFANGVTCNADMRPAEVRQFCELDEAGRNLMKNGQHAIAAFRASLSQGFKIGQNDRRLEWKRKNHISSFG
jgi:predicted ATPase with chaperone activity